MLQLMSFPNFNLPCRHIRVELGRSFRLYLGSVLYTFVVEWKGRILSFKEEKEGGSDWICGSPIKVGTMVHFNEGKSAAKILSINQKSCDVLIYEDGAQYLLSDGGVHHAVGEPCTEDIIQK